MSDRGVHPDLLEETQAAAAEAEAAPEPQRTRARPSRRSAPAEPVEAAPTSPQEGESTDTEPAAPDWMAQLDQVTDPVEKFKLLSKNLPRDVLEKDETLSGLIGHKADALLRKREADAIEQAKREAAQNNDLYTLGELEQRRLQQEQAVAQAASQAAGGGFMDGVVLFQQSLDRSIQEKVGGQTFGAGKSHAEGVAEYLQFVHDEAVKLGVEKERRNIESALRKSVLSEVNGDEPVPERESGTPGRVREVTDEQIEAMTMREYEALFDENGHPKPGVRHRATRSIPLTHR